MVVMQLPDGTAHDFLLDDTHHALRLVSHCASYDLLTVLTDSGWRILDVTTDRELQCLAALLTSARQRDR
jgi:hypothetical protein